MTDEQIAWAMQHDWYYYTGTNSVTGERCVHVKDDMLAGHHLQFTSFSKLQIWAGY